MIGNRPRLATALLVVAVGCSDDSTAPVEVPTPTSVTVSTSSLRFSSLGETAQLTATVHDQNGQVMADAIVTWESADASVAAVDQSGLVMAVDNGATNLKATAGNATAMVAVTVEQVPTSVVLSALSDSLAVGDSIQMIAEGLDGLGNPIAGVTLEWSSSDTTIATIDQEGWVRARAAGSAEITVTAGTTVSATTTITTVQVPSTIALWSPRDSVAVGDSVQLTAEAFDALGNAIADVSFEWSSSDTTVATVDKEGWVRARAAGSAEITVTAGTTVSATTTITTVQVPSTIALWSPRDSVAVGDSVQLTAEAFDALGNAIADVSFKWSSSDTTVATVDQEGWVRARAAGSAEITVTAGTTASATTTITTVQVPSTIALWSPRDSVAVGDSVQLTAEAFDALGNAIADVSFEWSSSDTTVAMVDQEGWVRVKAAGSVEISVKWGDLSASSSLISFDEERAALEAFYYATGGPEWKNNSNWLTDRPLSQWYGVKTDAAGKVVELDFNKNGLRGRLPVELTRLASLRVLRLWGDWEPGISLTGPIPAELAQLANLNHLNLTNNELTGEIPPELGSLGKLKSLSLSQNNLTGPIPTELGNLSGLTGLRLLNNRLTGPIPSELGNLTSLRELQLGGNELTGEIPAELGNLVELTELVLGGSGLTGQIPAELGNLAKLEVIFLHSTSVSGPIPSELGGLSQLRTLWMPLNALTGSIPPELCSHL